MKLQSEFDFDEINFILFYLKELGILKTLNN